MKKRQAKARGGTLGDSTIQVRTSGILARPDARDRKRADAAKANKDRTILNALLVKDQADFARYGKQYILRTMEDMIDMDHDASDELQPLAQALTEVIKEELTGSFAESLTMIGELGFQENALATQPGQDES